MLPDQSRISRGNGGREQFIKEFSQKPVVNHEKIILCILISTAVMIFLVALKVSADNIPSVVENNQQAI